MKSLIKLSIVLLIFLAKTQASISQTSVTPMVGYEWSIFYPVPDIINTSIVQPIYFPRHPHKYPLKSPRVGFVARKYIGSNSILKIGTLYSRHSFNAVFPNSLFHDIGNIQFRRIMASAGFEYQMPSNIFFAGNFVYHYIYRFTGYGLLGDKLIRPNRKHLSFEVNIGFTYKNVLLQLHYDLGLLNLYDVVIFSATTPINGFGVTLGYQFEF